MATILAKTSEAAGAIQATLQALQVRLAGLGLNPAGYDAAGQAVVPLAPSLESCRRLHRAGCPVVAEMDAAACQVMSSRQPFAGPCPCGGCLIAVPVIRRRRVLGALAACYPTVESLQDGSLQAACRAAGVDWAELAEAAGRQVRRSRRTAPELLEAVHWTVGLQQQADLARREVENLSANLASTYEELSLLYRISGSMKVTQPPPEFLRSVCEDLLAVMNISAAAAVVFAPSPGQEQDLVVLAGSAGLGPPQVQALAAEQAAHRVHRNHPRVDNDFAASSGRRFGGAVANLIAAPLLTDRAPMGILLGLNKLQGDFDSVDLKLISSIANQAAVFLSNSRLYAELQDLLMGVLHALTASIDAKDPYTSGHSARVAALSQRIAQQMGYPPAKVQQLYLTGLLHDIGKIGVPERVLCKPGRLTPEEYELVKAHPAVGARILGGIRHLDEVVEGILTHHERPDGRGYPRGLRGAEVPREGLIVGLADSFDAMTSDRTYRAAMPLEDVLREIRRGSGTQFDPRIVQTFLAVDLGELMKQLPQSSRPDLVLCGVRETSP